jgi:iron complex transport system ATP-binding protein
VSVEIRQLCFSYGRIEALRQVSASAAPGRITALLGPNASGKSTLLRCVIGALRPSAGAVQLDGVDPHRIGARRLARLLAYVPQRSTVAAAFTTREVVELGRHALSADRRRVEKSLEALHLADLADRPYPTLSVGQQQRVTLARALAQADRGGHLVLDEPMSAMDLAHVQLSLHVLRQRAADGATVVMAMHDIALAAAVADDVWVLGDGTTVASGPVATVLTPARLEEVFAVPFHQVRDEHDRPALVPETMLMRATERPSD